MKRRGKHRATETRSGQVSLERALSKLGYCSRGRARELIGDGRVAVNGTVQRSTSFRLQLESDRILVDGRRVRAARPTYLMLNKPRGLVTTASDEQDRDTVYACLTDPTLPWLAPVGRLDMASEGLLLFTNDTRWASRLMDPASKVIKRYHVQIDTLADDGLLEQLEAGVGVGGIQMRAAAARQLRQGSRKSWLEIDLHGGRNRQIRRMMEALGIEVSRLVRVAIGPLELGDLPRGAYRLLTTAEREALAAAAGHKGEART